MPYVPDAIIIIIIIIIINSKLVYGMTATVSVAIA